MIVLPERFNYVEAYLTLRCNLGCGYCINNVDGVKRDRKELTADQWVQALNKIGFGEVPITFGGGEPTLHPGFFDILEGIRQNVDIDLLTNLTFDVDKFIERTSPARFTESGIPHYHPIRASFHVDKTDRDLLIRNAKTLRSAGFNVGIFGLTHPHYINDNMEVAFRCSKENVPFYSKDFMGEVEGKMFGFFKYPEGVDGKAKDAVCRTRELLIAPDGDVYRCHRDLYHAENAVGNITHPGFEIRDIYRPCNNYGLCNPCDCKAKTNRFLRGIECQVEIIGDDK